MILLQPLAMIFHILYRCKEQLQAEISSLSKEKSNIEADINDLKQQELVCHQKLESVGSQVKEAEDTLSHTRDELKKAKELLQTHLDNTIKLSSTNIVSWLIDFPVYLHPCNAGRCW